MTRRVPLIVVVTALLATAAFWFLLYDPRRQEEARLREEIAEFEQQISQTQGTITTLREVEDNAETYRSELSRLVELVPDAPAQPDTLRELQRVADEAGVDITELTFADPEVAPNAPPTGDPATVLARIPLQMTVEGGYFQMVDMQRRIEVDLARAVKVDTVGITESEDNFPRLTVTSTGYIYAVLPVEDVGGDAEAGQSPPQAPSQPDGGSGATEAPTGGASPEQPADGATEQPTGEGGAAPDTSGIS